MAAGALTICSFAALIPASPPSSTGWRKAATAPSACACSPTATSALKCSRALPACCMGACSRAAWSMPSASGPSVTRWARFTWKRAALATAWRRSISTGPCPRQARRPCASTPWRATRKTRRTMYGGVTAGSPLRFRWTLERIPTSCCLPPTTRATGFASRACHPRAPCCP